MSYNFNNVCITNFIRSVKNNFNDSNYFVSTKKKNVTINVDGSDK